MTWRHRRRTSDSLSDTNHITHSDEGNEASRKSERWKMRFYCLPLRVACVFVCVRVYMCVSETAVMCVNESMPVQTSACLCMRVCVCICWHMCTCAVSMCVCSIQLETSNPTFLFHCLNERVKSLLVVITVINDFFSAFPPMKSTLTSSTFPSAVGCGLFCKEIPLFMFKWVLHYVLLFNHWPFYALHFPWVYMCAWVFLCVE